MAYTQGRCLLKQLLKERKITQSQLARKTKISRQMISEYATNKSYMSPGVMLTIAYVLECPMEDLYDWDWNERS